MSWNNGRLGLLLSVAAVLGACDRKGSDMLPQPVEEFPVILELGELRVLGRNEAHMLPEFAVPESHQAYQASESGYVDGFRQWSSVLIDPAEFTAAGNTAPFTANAVGSRYTDDLIDFDSHYDWCELMDDEGRRNCYFGQIGPPEAGKRGGGTFTFTVPDVVPDTYQLDPALLGIEGSDLVSVYVDESSPQAVKDAVRVDTVCVAIDSETIFWNHWLSPDPAERLWLLSYPDQQQDDGDLDLFGGMTSYYTGSPGLELGNFRGFYTDDLGRQIEIEFNECFREGLAGDGFEAHAGRGALDYCELDVEGRNGIEFTMLLDTFSVPLDDGALSFGAMVFNGPCGQTTEDSNLGRELGMSECLLPGESLTPEKNGYTPRTCVEAFEEAACASTSFLPQEPDSLPPMQEFCCAHEGFGLDLCNEVERPDDACRQFQTSYASENGDARSNYCATFPERCCEYYEEGIGDRFYQAP